MFRIAKAVVLTAAASAALIATTGAAAADSGAQGAAVNSPGFGSGNLFQMPIHFPVNLCGNTGNDNGLLNPAFGNACVNR